MKIDESQRFVVKHILQVAPANAKTKTCKRACLPERTADWKDAAKMKEK